MPEIKSERELDRLRAANAVVAEVQAELKKAIRPGCTTKDIDSLAERLIESRGGKPAFKGYHGYPANVCASVNEEVVHGIPSRRELASGDIVSVDVGVWLDGYIGDAAVTYPVGAISAEARRLLNVARSALERAICAALVGNRVSDISRAIQDCAESEGFSVVRDFVGHGIGRAMHEDPQVPNFVSQEAGARLRAGMVLAIEPMVNAGTHEVVVGDDGWTVVTRDGKLSAHFEHSVAILDEGPEVLSKLTGEAVHEPRVDGRPRSCQRGE